MKIAKCDQCDKIDFLCSPKESVKTYFCKPCWDLKGYTDNDYRDEDRFF